jgi:hypothetical protein
MRIKSLVAIMSLVISVLPGWNAFAAGQNEPGEMSTAQAAADEAPAAQPNVATPVNIEEGAALREQEPSMEQRPAPETTVRVRSTRPRNDPHRDARACLDKENKTAIIICAEKYR